MKEDIKDKLKHLTIEDRIGILKQLIIDLAEQDSGCKTTVDIYCDCYE